MKPVRNPSMRCITLILFNSLIRFRLCSVNAQLERNRFRTGLNLLLWTGNNTQCHRRSQSYLCWGCRGVMRLLLHWAVWQLTLSHSTASRNVLVYIFLHNILICFEYIFTDNNLFGCSNSFFERFFLVFHVFKKRFLSLQCNICRYTIDCVWINWWISENAMNPWPRYMYD